MSQFILLNRFVNQLSYINRYPKGSILLLFKEATESPNGERFEVKLFELKTDRRDELFSHFLDHSEFNGYYVYPNHDPAYNLDAVREEFRQLAVDTNGNSFL